MAHRVWSSDRVIQSLGRSCRRAAAEGNADCRSAGRRGFRWDARFNSSMSPRRLPSLIGNGLVVDAPEIGGEQSSSVAERMIEANGVELCTEAFGDLADPPILLIMGIGASMLWWEEGFCRMLAGAGWFVIRYDHRDTGRSITYEPGQPEYTGADLTADAAGVLDGFGISAAHLVGVSAGGGSPRRLRSTPPTGCSPSP